MPQVLWGLSCLSLQRAASGQKLVEEFRAAMLPVTKHLQGNADSSTPRVEIFRLVPITNLSAELKASERVVCHFPDSRFDCSELEEMCQRCDDAEMLAERARESLLTSLRLTELRLPDMPVDRHHQGALSSPSQVSSSSGGRSGGLLNNSGRSGDRSGRSGGRSGEDSGRSGQETMQRLLEESREDPLLTSGRKSSESVVSIAMPSPGRQARSPLSLCFGSEPGGVCGVNVCGIVPESTPPPQGGTPRAGSPGRGTPRGTAQSPRGTGTAQEDGAHSASLLSSADQKNSGSGRRARWF